ncbi:MAG: divergent PAP2 family protein [Nanoarchaeota archaeon]|nr:divergent PAP2 family protein [Nanoarchaeota archaeon]MBU1321758.1 divergent PAP2 family protein [Nanoarchaeota archaeon]MBU1597493.1 divergent PAP2 family protein [Nanoarchaeota archaeon]MBU2441527.1 divergent PAP2 family protein [Nanoarchaeota archaeon]
MINELIFGIVIAWVLANIIKAIINWIKEKKISHRVFIYDGGMPSSHTVSVAALSAGIYLETGFSILFIMSVVITLIVINDALKVRWITEEQSRAINKLTQGKKGFKKMSEHVGHRPVEVFVGLLIGIIVPIIVYAII